MMARYFDRAQYLERECPVWKHGILIASETCSTCKHFYGICEATNGLSYVRCGATEWKR